MCLLGGNQISYIGVLPEPDKGSKLTQIVGIVASLAVVIGLIFNYIDCLSGWVQYAVLLALILANIFIIYTLFYETISIRFNQMRINRKHDKVARKYILDLEILVDKYQKIIENSNNITCVFDRLRSESDLFKFFNLNDPQLNQIKNLLFNINKSIKRFDGTGDEFKLIIEQFEVILSIYNELYIKSALKDIRLIKNLNGSNPTNEAIPKRIKGDYENQRGTYEKFLEKYIEFGERVNREYGTNIVRTYSEKFEEL